MFVFNKIDCFFKDFHSTFCNFLQNSSATEHVHSLSYSSLPPLTRDAPPFRYADPPLDLVNNFSSSGT